MPPADAQRPVVEIILIANNVEVLNKREFQHNNRVTAESLNEFKIHWKRRDEFLAGRIIVESVCPNIFERSELKLGILLTLIGGVSQKFDEKPGMKIRGTIHLLMVGEPGTGKS